jgi:hypothetical protein
MLPASDLTEILANLNALNLQPTTAAQILAAVLAPLLRSAEAEAPVLPRQHAERPRRRPRRTARSKPRRPSPRKRRRYKRHAPTEARDRALAALRTNPDATPTEIAKIAKVSRSTAVIASKELAKEARKAARKDTRTEKRKTPRSPPDKRSRAAQFLRSELAAGPMQVSDIEDAAAKAHVDPQALEQARADVGVVVSRANTGGAHAVQWSLPA